MNNATKNFLQDLFIKVYNNDLEMYEELGTEENMLLLYKHVFGKMITFDDIEDCAKIIGNDDVAKVLADQFLITYNRIDNMIYRMIKHAKFVMSK